MIILSIGMLCVLAGHVNAAPFAFSVGRFQVEGNLPGNAVDEFDDDTLTPWFVDNGTAVEENGMLTLTSPGDIVTIQIDNSFITQEESEVISWPNDFKIADGAGDFVVTSTWTTGIPGQNQRFHMEYDIPRVFLLPRKISPGTFSCR
jgi:hypothetical protein